MKSREEIKFDHLYESVFLCVANAKRICGGDGKGCDAVKSYYKNIKRRWRKCHCCPMEFLNEIIDVVEPELYESSLLDDDEYDDM